MANIKLLPQTTLDSPKVLELPIMKHFDAESLSTNPKGWKDGQKTMAWLIGLGLGATLAYFVVKYVLPAVFIAIGQTLGAISAAVLVLAFFVFLPVIMKGLKRASRWMHKLLIKSDPFAELENQKQKMISNRGKFKQAKAKIKAIKSNMEQESVKAEKEAKDYQDKVVALQQVAEKTKTKMDEIERSLGEAAAKDSDEYVENQTKLMRTLSEAQRVSQMLNQSTGLVRKYGTRAHVIGKLDRKLNMVDTAMEIKIADFDVSIDMLKKEYAFARAAKEATDNAKSAMLFTKDWELEYALDLVTNTIAMDLASTQENLLDLDSLTQQYTFDSDELYTRLDKLADQIKTDAYVIPDSKKYNNPNYKPTAEDKSESGGFGDLF